MDNDMEMKERGRDREEADEQEEEGETSFNDDDRRREDESILIIDGSNPVFTRADDNIPNVRRDAGVMRRHIIHDKKQFLKNGLGITVNKRDGPNSTRLYDELRTTFDGRCKKINGATYRRKKILILKNGKMEYSTDKSEIQYVNEFKKLLRKADAEHQKTPTALAEKHVDVDLPQDVMDDVAENLSDRMNSTIEERVEDFTTNTEITNNELRELRGILNVKGSTGEEKLAALKVESEYWTKKANEEQNNEKAKLYEAIAKTADLKADEIRLRLNQKLTSEEGIAMLNEEAENNDLTNFEKFKKWVRENMVGLSAVAISIAGILTTVIMTGRKVLRKGAQGLSSFGPLFAALGNLLVKILEFGAKVLEFLSKNLWLLALTITYFVYNEYKDRKKKTHL